MILLLTNHRLLRQLQRPFLFKINPKIIDAVESKIYCCSAGKIKKKKVLTSVASSAYVTHVTIHTLLHHCKNIHKNVKVD